MSNFELDMIDNIASLSSNDNFSKARPQRSLTSVFWDRLSTKDAPVGSFKRGSHAIPEVVEADPDAGALEGFKPLQTRLKRFLFPITYLVR